MFFFFNDTATTEIYPLSLHDALPISNVSGNWAGNPGTVYFNFVHRFTASDAPQRKVSNFPTFLVAAGLPYRLLVGFNYSTNSEIGRAHVWNSSHANISYAVFCLKKKK